MDYYGLYGYGWIGNIEAVPNNFSLPLFIAVRLLSFSHLDISMEVGGCIYTIPRFPYLHLPTSQPYIPPPRPHLFSSRSLYLQDNATLSALLPSVSYREYLDYSTHVCRGTTRRVAATILDKPYEGKQKGGEENSICANEAPI